MELHDLRPLQIFDGLSDEQIGELVAAGSEVAIAPGVDLFVEGTPADFWWVLVDGTIDLVRRTGREDTVVRHMDDPGNWAGGFRAWDEQGVYLATGRGASAGRVLRVPADVLRDRAQAWFPFGGHLIRGLYHTARSIESTVRQRESLVQLGTLAAGLAHELNNPAAAATRAVDALDDAAETLLRSLTHLAGAQISAEQFAGLDAIRKQARPAVTDPDPLARADREEALANWLGHHGVASAWTIAPPLAAAGVDLDWCEEALTVLGPAALGPGVEWVASTFSISMLLTEVKESTGRISGLVASVRSYTQVDRASLGEIVVTEGLDSTLVMLGHKLRQGVIVDRSYDPGVPRIPAYAGELNQVWTNLIGNAVDAMGGVGVLRLTTRLEEDHVAVEIGDTGPGMPAEVASHAFEAFFTTKDVGQGTGLGLDIARRIIVERHGGTIAIDSRPGDTVLRVCLPLRSPTSS